MKQLAAIAATRAPAIVAAAGEHAAFRFFEFFTAQIRNSHTRRAYQLGIEEFFAWLATRGVYELTAVTSVHIAGYIEQLGRHRSAPTVKQRLAAIRSLLAWLAANGVLPFNPATAVRGPKHVVKKGKTPVLDQQDARAILDSIDVSTPIGLRDRALIALMIYTFARIGAATTMRVRDVFTQKRRLWVRLQEKGGKEVALPCHHNLESYLQAYLDEAGLSGDADAPLFQTIARGTGQLSGTALPSQNAYAMVQRRAAKAGVMTQIGNHTFRATGITAYLKNGGTLEKAASIANHSSTRTTQLYDRRNDDVNLDEIERISI